MEHAHDVDVGSDALSIARWRELLGDEADSLPDHDIDRIRRHADAMARVIVEIFLEQRAAQEYLGSEPCTDHLAALREWV